MKQKNLKNTDTHEQGLSISKLSKIVMYELWYDYMKPKYKEKAKLCLMDKDSFILSIKTEDVYADITNDIETQSDTSNYELDILLPKGKKKIVIGLMKHELGGKIKKEFAALRAKTYNYLTDNNDGDKTAKGTKKYAIKDKLKFEDYKNCLEATQLEN